MFQHDALWSYALTCALLRMGGQPDTIAIAITIAITITTTTTTTTTITINITHPEDGGCCWSQEWGGDKNAGFDYYY